MVEKRTLIGIVREIAIIKRVIKIIEVIEIVIRMNMYTITMEALGIIEMIETVEVVEKVEKVNMEKFITIGKTADTIDQEIMILNVNNIITEIDFNAITDLINNELHKK